MDAISMIQAKINNFCIHDDHMIHTAIEVLFLTELKLIAVLTGVTVSRPSLNHNVCGISTASSGRTYVVAISDNQN